ncbi:hypothetical protein QQ045_007015 [Rhodiola kirilowii]
MKQKIVLQLEMHSEKCRKKAMEIAAGTDGVMSISTTGAEGNRLVVVGVGIDSATLTRSLRKKVGHTNIISIKKMDEDEDDEDNDEGNNRGSYRYNYYAPYSAPPPPGYAVVPYGAPQFTNSWFNW